MSVAYHAFRQALFLCVCKRPKYLPRIASSITNAETVRKAEIASAANCELPLYTSAFIASNCSSNLMRMNAANRTNGIAAKTATRLSFQPNVKAMMIQPRMLKIEISGKAPFVPSRSWICFGSVERRETRDPEAFSFKS